MSETFDVLAFIEGIDYPEADVSVYTNVAALAKRAQLDEDLNNTADSEAAKAIEEEMAALVPTIEASALIFTLRGKPFQEAKEIADIFTDEGATEAQLLDLIQQSIVAVKDAKGAKSSIPGVEQLKAIHRAVSPAEFNKLVDKTIEVNYSAAKYESETDAGFPGGSADVA